MRRSLILIAVVLVVAGCSGEPAPAANAVRSEPVRSPSPLPTTPPAPATITVAFGGDVHFVGKTRPLLDDPATAFGPVSAILRAADIAMVNLETAVTQRGTPEPGKPYTFRAPPAAFDAITAAGLDAVSVANNHALDYGQVGLADTLSSAAAAGVRAVGAGVDASAAYAPWVTTVRGVRVAVLAFSQIWEYSPTWVATDTRPGLALAVTSEQIERAAQAVRAARAQAEVVVVFMHWGVEVQQCPNGQQRATAQALADAGATMIVGTHAHTLQGDGWLGNTYVAYGMSNFIWYSNNSPSYDTGVVVASVTGGSVSRVGFVPAVIDRATGQPIPVRGDEAARVSAVFASLHACTGLADAPARSQTRPARTAVVLALPARHTVAPLVVTSFDRLGAGPAPTGTVGRRTGIRFGRPVTGGLEFSSVAGDTRGMRT